MKTLSLPKAKALTARKRLKKAYARRIDEDPSALEWRDGTLYCGRARISGAPMVINRDRCVRKRKSRRCDKHSEKIRQAW